eukprot:1156671-Pelagomonas_calceolata.AAC.1
MVEFCSASPKSGPLFAAAPSILPAIPYCRLLLTQQADASTAAIPSLAAFPLSVPLFIALPRCSGASTSSIWDWVASFAIALFVAQPFTQGSTLEKAAVMWHHHCDSVPSIRHQCAVLKRAACDEHHAMMGTNDAPSTHCSQGQHA